MADYSGHFGKDFMNDLNELLKDAPQGAFSEYDAEVLINELQKVPEGGTYVEIGVDKGRSLWVARQIDSSLKVYGVDIQEDPRIEGTTFYQNDSVVIARDWKNGPIDLLFIDGDHSYEGCKRDIEAWFTHMKPHGVILFHDADETSPGVIWAISEFFTKNVKKIQSLQFFKRTDKNTSMARIEL